MTFHIELPALYPHQEDMRDRTRASLAKNRRVVLCTGCGVGKTRISKWILGASANREHAEHQSGLSLFVVQGRPLVHNASKSFSEEPGLPHGVVMSGEKPAWAAKTQVASIDTLLSWFFQDGQYNTSVTFDLLVVDETDSHFSKFKKFLKYHDAYRKELGLHPAYVIGLTATPDAKGLSDVYREIVFGPPTDWLMNEGFLSPFRYFRATQGKLEKLVLRGGEYTHKSECEAMDRLAGSMARDWKRLGEGRPTVGFFPRRSHARDAMQELRAAGIRTEYVDCETPDDQRARIFWELHNWKIDYLCNVDLVGRGTDIPAISCIQLCVAIGSERAFIQKLGRGSRVDDGRRDDGPDVPPKRDCIVIDHGPSLARHGFFEDPRHWSLDRSTNGTGEVGVRPTVECPQCCNVYRGGRCRNCGYEPTGRERKAQGLEFDGSELVEVKKTEKKPKSVKGAEDLMLKALYSAGRSGRTWKQAVGIFFGMNRQQGTTHKIPKRVTVGGHTYRMPPYGSADSGERVKHLYPFTAERGNHSGDYLER